MGDGTRKIRRWLTRRLLALLVLVVVWLALVMIMPMADWLLLFPSTHKQDAMGAKNEMFAGGAGQLEVFIARTARAEREGVQAYVLHYTGNAGRGEHGAKPVADLWWGHAVEVWAINYPGYGASTGPARLRGLARSGLDLYDHVAKLADKRPIYVHGLSIGCTVALHVATERPVDGVVLQLPPPLKSIILEDHGWWNLWLLSAPVAWSVPGELEAMWTAPRVTAPGLVIVAGADATVPTRHQKRVYEAYAGEKRLVEMDGVDHNDWIPFTHTGPVEQGMSWLVERAGARR